MRAGRWWFLLVVSVAVAAASWWLNWAEFVGVAAGLFAVAVFAMFLRRPRKVSWHDEDVPVRVARGDAAQVRISVSLHGSARWVRAVSVAGGQSQEVAAHGALLWPIDTRRRGRFLVGPDQLEFADPFGLRRRLLATREPSPVVVVPRVSKVPVIQAVSTISGGVVGERTGVEHVVALREYVVGDPRKLIHWKASAHHGSLLVRRLVDATVPTVLITLDVNQECHAQPGALFGEYSEDAFEAAVDLAASWACGNCLPGQRVLVTTTGMDAEVVEGSLRQRDVVLDWLACVESSGAEQCVPDRLVPIALRRSAGQVIFVSGRPGARSEPVRMLVHSAARAGLALRVVTPA